MSESVERKPVHPTTDRTWRNTNYDLTKMPLEAARMFYRTRLEVVASDPAVEPWQAMLEVFLGWIVTKELRRMKRGSECLMAQIPRPEGLMASGFVRGSYTHACAESYLRTDAAFASEDDELPQHWALEYVERDGTFGYRFWVTEIGISGIAADRWAVNARVRYYDDPTYIYEVSKPERNAPRFIKELILKRGLVVKCGGMPLRTSAAVLTHDNFDLFVEQLIDEERTAPLVVVSRHDPRESDTYPVDPKDLARLLTGVAVVYALDRSDPALERSYSYVFDNPEKPAYKYRLVPGCLRIFWGGVDLDEPTEYDYARHRFFTSEALEALGANAIIQNISAGVSRMFSLRAGEVLSVRSVAYQASLLRTGKLEQSRLALTERLRDAEARRATLEDELEEAGEDQGRFDAYREQVDLLNELLETADAEIRELKERQGQSSGGVTDDEYQLQAQDLERARYEALEAQDKVVDLEKDNGRLHYRVDQLEGQLRDAQASAKASDVQAQLLFEVGHELRDPVKVVEVAKTAFADRLVFLDGASESAQAYKGDAGEMFDGLAAMYQHLWPLRFGDEGDVNVDEDEFQNRSGFGLTFHESKQTKRNPRLAKQRQVEYHGKACDMSPHIKGGDKKRGYLRIHFFFDGDARTIVIGHCGNHMETDGTAKM